MKIHQGLLLAGLALVLGCDKSEPISSKLKQRIRFVKTTAPCDAIIPMEWASSLPVPLSGKTGTEFKIFFFPIANTAKGIEIYTPQGEATINTESSSVSCKTTPNPAKVLSNRRWSQEASAMNSEQFKNKSDLLLDRTEKVAQAYATGKKNVQRKLLMEYASLFKNLSEPDFLPLYYDLNPDFWNWLEKETGHAIGFHK